MTKAIINGEAIHYEIIGSGEPVLFLHGMGGTWKMWEPQFEFFSKEFKLILVDMRGHGESTTKFKENKYTFEEMAADLPLLLDYLNIKQVHVVGVSMGGVIAQILAYSYPEYVKDLVLADTFCEIPDQVGKFVLGLTVLLAKILPISFINNATYSLYKGKEEEQVYTREILKKSLSFSKDSFIALKTISFPNMKPNLKEIQVPTLVVYGDRKSYGIDEEKGARTIFKEISNATLVNFEKAFDPVPIMRKDQFNQVVYHFFKGMELPEMQGVGYETK